MTTFIVFLTLSFRIEHGIGTCHLDQDYIVAFSHFAPRPLFQYPALPLLHYFAPPFLCANLPFRQLPPVFGEGMRSMSDI
ncbi:hypothetical protein HOLleu_14707 [Holothuria leucospilota]|uniref:Secreted protein n=1 Tax=Holothuria leucospilota TaxID=206669 RepID=A0A9Q1HCK4_HOLLE|nr:hypothetical protein HOLleu_14707 [Holothuria leucospilota]